MTKQISLPGFDIAPTSAEVVFTRLAGSWRKQCADVQPDHPLPRSLDEIALAALLLAVEHGDSFSRAARAEAELAMAACEKRLIPWLDRLPWHLSACFSDGCIDRVPLERLITSLSHPKSDVRVWILELAWIVRRELELSDARAPLLENVASTLIGVEMSWGLAGELFWRIEDFVREAEEYEPQDFSRQYKDRVEGLKLQSLIQTQSQFWWTESRCRRVITESAFSLGLPESDRQPE